jgi:hypothetical protein
MAEEAPEAVGLKVVRDASYARVYADNGAAFVVGRDVEIAYMIASPDVTVVEVTPKGGHSELTTETVYVELCRVRMSTHSALGAALNVVFALLEEGKLEVEALRKNIEAMIAQVSRDEEDSRRVD